MKIIGKANSGFLVEMSATEISHFAYGNSNYSELQVKSKHGTEEKKRAKDLEVGHEIDVSESYEKSREIFDSFDELKTKISSIKKSCTIFENSIKNN